MNTLQKVLILIALAWIAGYFGFSPAWGIALLILFILHKIRKRKSNELRLYFSTLSDTDAVAMKAKWVNFPDFERSEFINQLVQKFWPFCCDYLKNTIFLDVIERTVKSSSPIFSDFKFIQIDLGDMAPQIGGIRFHSKGTRFDEVILDTEILYSGDAEIKFSLKRITAGIKNIQLCGDARICLKPLTKQFPFVSNVGFYFLRYPHIDFDFTNAAVLVDIPGIRDAIMQVVTDIVAGLAVLPNKFIMPLLPSSNADDLLRPNTKGVISLNIVSARSLMKLDFGIIGKSKSDPYVNVYVNGGLLFRTSIKSNTSNPDWDERTNIIVNDNEHEHILFELRDEDPGEDDYLGSCTMTIEEIITSGSIDRWMILENASSGELYVEANWLHAVQSKPSIPTTQVSKNEDKFPKAILTVFVGAVNNLQRVKRKGSYYTEPNPYVVFRIEQQTAKTRVFLNTTDPHFSHVEQFLLKHPDSNYLSIKVEDQKTNSTIGLLRIPLKSIYQSTNFEIEKTYNLSTITHQQSITSTIFLHLSMRVLIPSKLNGIDTVNRIKTNRNHMDIESKDSSTEYSFTSEQSNMTNLTEHVFPTIDLLVKYNVQRQVLIVKVVSANNLSHYQFSDRKVDSYVKLWLSSNPKVQVKTNTIRNNNNPIFQQTFEWEIEYEKVKGQLLCMLLRSPASLFTMERSHKLGEVFINLSKLDVYSQSSGSYPLKSNCKDPEDLAYT